MLIFNINYQHSLIFFRKKIKTQEKINYLESVLIKLNSITFLFIS